MTELFTLENLIAVGLLTLLQAVLGFDNLLYISLESKRAPAHQQALVRKLGIGIALLFRIALLFLLLTVIQYFQDPLFEIHLGEAVHGAFSVHSIIVLFGGAFILYTAVKEILHMMRLDDDHASSRPSRSMGSVVFWIVLMNLVFSFDSILSAIALTDVFAVMATAIVIGGVLMIWLAERVAAFLEKNRMYEVLGLFVLFVVGIMLLTEGGHLSHLELGGNPVHAMTKTTFYFVIGVLVLTDIVQGRYQKKLMARSHAVHPKAEKTPG